MSDRRAPSAHDLIIDAARTQVAKEGLRGLSVRKVAARAGSSRGGVTYKAGSKADLFENLIADTLAFQRRKHDRWLDLTARLDLSSGDVLAAVVAAFLDESAVQEASQSLVLCELVAEGARKKERRDDLAALIVAEEAFWCTVQRDAPHAAILGWAIANYCRDELPFAVALHGIPEYHLLRSATIGRLVQKIAPIGKRGFAVGFDGFGEAVDRGSPEGDPAARRANAIGSAVADLVQREGIAAVTHRSVAAAAGIPKSSIAHHFRTREDLLKAGFAAIYRKLAAAEGLLAPQGGIMPDMALSIASHSVAIEATRDGSLVASALSLRKMRGEFISSELPPILGAGRSDMAGLQVAGMIIVGAGLALHLSGGEILRPLAQLESLVSG